MHNFSIYPIAIHCGNFLPQALRKATFHVCVTILERACIPLAKLPNSYEWQSWECSHSAGSIVVYSPLFKLLTTRLSNYSPSPLILYSLQIISSETDWALGFFFLHHVDWNKFSHLNSWLEQRVLRLVKTCALERYDIENAIMPLFPCLNH